MRSALASQRLDSAARSQLRREERALRRGTDRRHGATTQSRAAAVPRTCARAQAHVSTRRGSGVLRQCPSAAGCAAALTGGTCQQPRVESA